MIAVLIYIFSALAAIVFIALILPVKFYIHASGGTEDGFEISGKIMLFCGLAGGGLLYSRDMYRLAVFLYSWRLLSINIQPLIRYFSEKGEKKKKEKKKIEKPPEKKRPVIERIKIFYHKAAEYRGYFKPVYSDIRKIVRMDLFSTHIKLGLNNPCLTGKIIGIIYTINSILPQPYVITPSWDFTKTVLQGELSTKITFLSHIFWGKIIVRLPLIISIIRRHKTQKKYFNNTLAAQEV